MGLSELLSPIEIAAIITESVKYGKSKPVYKEAHPCSEADGVVKWAKLKFLQLGEFWKAAR